VSGLSRRRWLQALALGAAAPPPRLAGAAPEPERPGSPAAPETCPETRLALHDFEPRSMLRTSESRVESARFPVIDVHAHLSGEVRRQDGAAEPDVILRGEPGSLLEAMDRRNVRTIVNLTGGTGDGLRRVLAGFDEAHPGRFLTATVPSYELLEEPRYPQLQADSIQEAAAAGARGLKILKTLGLYLRDAGGKLVAVDDPRFDPMWETCGGLGLPVFIHVADPAAFFLPADRFNERYEELAENPDWSFHGGDFPSREQLLEARNRVVARHPRTRFVGLHVGNNPEDLEWVSGCLDRYPNLDVEIGARIAELGRQPRGARRFFDRHRERILFGSDVVTDEPAAAAERYAARWAITFRFLETEDEYFPYWTGRVPSQGRWHIYGLGLSDEILRSVYHDNAARLLGLPG